MKEHSYTIQYKAYRPDELPERYKALVEEAKKQTQMSYAPYSNFHVGAAVQLETGEIIGGNNQENAAYPSGLCAERTAIFYANSQHPDVPVTAIAVACFTDGAYLEESITPCGGCRQVLLESENRYGRKMEVILFGAKNVYIFENAGDLLPLSFGKDSLLKL